MPSISKRGDTFRIMVSLGYGMDGRQIRKTTTYTPPEGVTAGKAEKLATAYAFEFEKSCQGMVNMNDNLRFSELVTWYYTQIAPHKLKESTLYGNRKLIDLYVLPYLGNVKLKDISTARIDGLFNTLLRSGATKLTFRLKSADVFPMGTWRPACRKSGVCMGTLKTAIHGGAVTKVSAEKLAGALGKTVKELFEPAESGGGLDPQTIMRVRTCISPIFNTAVKKGILLKNPVAHATSPKVNDDQKLFLDANQCKQLLTFLDEPTNPQIGKVIATLLYTGMRVGELMALHWEDVDLDKAMLSVRYTLYRVKGEYKLSSPKTRRSARTIALPPQLIQLLRDQRRWQIERRMAVGNRWIDRGAVFTGEYGEYMNRTYVNNEFHKLLSQHDFPNMHVHDLRHANASLLINMGVPVKVIAEHLGHVNTSTTENIYAHVFNETKVQASDAISRALASNS